LEAAWEKPVLIFYKEKHKEPERRSFAVVKARRLSVVQVGEGTKLKGDIKDFFPLMGDVDYVFSTDGRSDRYVLCWFDDKEDDFNKAWRRLNGVTFQTRFTFTTNEKGKRTYNANFEAEHGKLK
jgi:hypothetical protein